MIVMVVDCGMGNVGSVLNMLRKVGVVGELTRKPEDVLRADRIILPGVGAFDSAMRRLRELRYVAPLTKRVIADRVPILGICLGMQILGNHSEEGKEPGLGWLDATTLRFRFDDLPQGPRIPHMAWNTVRACKESPFFPRSGAGQRFYFVHSFHIECSNPADVLSRTQYGVEFTSAVCHENILGTQFHPEKSHRFGLEFLRAFLAWSPGSASGGQRP